MSMTQQARQRRLNWALWSPLIAGSGVGSAIAAGLVRWRGAAPSAAMALTLLLLALAAWLWSKDDHAPDLLGDAPPAQPLPWSQRVWLAACSLWMTLVTGGLAGLLALAALCVLRTDLRRGSLWALGLVAGGVTVGLLCGWLASPHRLLADIGLANADVQGRHFEHARLLSNLARMSWLGASELPPGRSMGLQATHWPLAWMAHVGRLPVLVVLASVAAAWCGLALALIARARPGGHTGLYPAPDTWLWRLAAALASVHAAAATCFVAWISGWLRLPLAPGLPPLTARHGWWLLTLCLAALLVWLQVQRPGATCGHPACAGEGSLAATGQLTKRLQRHIRRLRALGARLRGAALPGVMLLALGVLGMLRLPDLTPQRSTELDGSATPAPRLHLLDRHGLMLAHDVPALDLWIVPRQFLAPCDQSVCSPRPEHQARIDRLLRAAAGDPETVDQLKRALGPHARFSASSPRVAVAYGLVAVDERSVRRLQIDGLQVTTSRRRVYPQGNLFAHAVGVVQRGSDGRGQDGAELRLQSHLEVEQRGVELLTSDGLNTTLDRHIQALSRDALEQALRGKGAASGAVVVADALSGAIRSMVSLPDYDPNRAGTFRNPYRPERLYNHATAQAFALSGLVVPLSAALAIERHDMQPFDLLRNRALNLPRRPGLAPTPVSRSPEWVTLTDMVAQAHPAALAGLHQGWSAHDWADHLRLLSWADPPEQPGLMPGPTSHVDDPSQWSSAEHPWWHLRLHTTLVQLMQQYQPLANDGRMAALHLRATEEMRNCLEYDDDRICLSLNKWHRDTARAVRKMLAQATLPGGTLAELSLGDIAIGGVAAIVPTQPRGPTPEGGQAPTTTHAHVAVAMLPAHRPRWLVGVLVNTGPSGRQVDPPPSTGPLGHVLRSLAVELERQP